MGATDVTFWEYFGLAILILFATILFGYLAYDLWRWAAGRRTISRQQWIALKAWRAYRAWKDWPGIWKASNEARPPEAPYAPFPWLVVILPVGVGGGGVLAGVGLLIHFLT
jgi:hypothetical protein